MGNSMEKSFDASNGYLIIVELDLTEDKILHNMNSQSQTLILIKCILRLLITIYRM